MGFNYDPPRYDKNHEQIVFSKEYDKYRKFHDDFLEAGIQYHTTILNSGWVDDQTYDYRLTDETLEHDYFGFNCPDGYAVNGGIGVFKDDRPNVDGKVGLQSFSSEKWIEDAKEALRRLIKHIQEGSYAKQVIGYHIAYGQLGETCLWGGWREREEHHRGDFGRANKKAFVKYGLNKYKTEEELLKKWGFSSLDEIETPSVETRDSAKEKLRDLFYDEAYNLLCLEYNEFMSVRG